MEIFKVTQTGTQVQEALNDGTSAYQKPVGGIPATDMSESVRQSLTAADKSIEKAFVIARAYATYNSGTGKYDLSTVTFDPYTVCVYNWKKNVLPLLRLTYPAQGQLPDVDWAVVPLVAQNVSGDDPDEFVGQIFTDEDTMVLVHLSSQGGYAVEKTV